MDVGVDSEPELVTRCCSTGDLPKQVKVKKLAKLKTLDTKPGKSFVRHDLVLFILLHEGFST